MLQVEGWNLINEDGKLKLNRSWKLKSFTKGLDLFKLVADVAEAEGILNFQSYLIQIRLHV